MDDARPTALLTGASGLVGGELVERLLAARPARRLYLLTRDRDRIPRKLARPEVTVVEGDLRKSGLGLDADRLDELRERVTEVVHCAADTRFDLPLEEARAANTAGTGNLLEIAAGCRKLEKFVHVSSVYAAGRMTGRIREGPLDPPPSFSSSYQQTKYEAEQLVLRRSGELPVAIVRLSSIIGDSRTGRVRQFNHVHQLMKLFPRQHLLPMVPADPAAPVDMVASDWIVGALAWLVDDGFAPGRVFHLCSGPGFPVAEMIDLTRNLFESHPKAARFRPIRVPRLVSLKEYEEFVGQARRTGHRLLVELTRVLSYFLPHLALNQRFENRLTLAHLAPAGIATPPIRDTYSKVVRYCLETDWGRG
jgi:nucleoside-diphosphate-sugar epimerase